MKSTLLLYSCSLGDSKILLRIEHWLVADYPMTYTFQECLEEFCESVGWRFMDSFGQENNLRDSAQQFYEFQLERPRGEFFSTVLMDACANYERIR